MDLSGQDPSDAETDNPPAADMKVVDVETKAVLSETSDDPVTLLTIPQNIYLICLVEHSGTVCPLVSLRNCLFEGALVDLAVSGRVGIGADGMVVAINSSETGDGLLDEILRKILYVSAVQSPADPLQQPAGPGPKHSGHGTSDSGDAVDDSSAPSPEERGWLQANADVNGVADTNENVNTCTTPSGAGSNAGPQHVGAETDGDGAQAEEHCAAVTLLEHSVHQNTASHTSSETAAGASNDTAAEGATPTTTSSSQNDADDTDVMQMGRTRPQGLAAWLAALAGGRWRVWSSDPLIVDSIKNRLQAQLSAIGLLAPDMRPTIMGVPVGPRAVTPLNQSGSWARSSLHTAMDTFAEWGEPVGAGEGGGGGVGDSVNAVRLEGLFVVMMRLRLRNPRMFDALQGAAKSAIYKKQWERLVETYSHVEDFADPSRRLVGEVVRLPL